MTSLTLKLPMISDHVQVSNRFCRYLIRVMLSALGDRSMRGIERVLAAILLLAAVGGAAVFARESGSGLAGAVHLAAPPDQHPAAPGSVLVALTASADHSERVPRPAAPPTLAALRQPAGAKATPTRPTTLPGARTLPRTVPQR